MADPIRVSVVLALRHEQPAVELEVERGTTAAEAVRLARTRREWPSWPEAYRLGIFGQLVPDDRSLRDGDRVEVLRPLVNDPKEIRRRRAAGTRGRRSARRR
jgi:putative ubiquitin-RnfH superfamily antitoxin RatB of RatAB toxin-antitoxin module